MIQLYNYIVINKVYGYDVNITSKLYSVMDTFATKALLRLLHKKENKSKILFYYH